MSYPERSCEGCGRQFVPFRKDKRYCTGICRTAYWRARVPSLRLPGDFVGAERCNASAEALERFIDERSEVDA